MFWSMSYSVQIILWSLDMICSEYTHLNLLNRLEIDDPEFLIMEAYNVE